MSNGDRKPRGLKPVEKVELSSKHLTLRYILMVVFILIALAAIWFGVQQCTAVETGMHVVEAASTDK